MTDTAPDVNGLINLLNALAIDFECDDKHDAKETCDKAAAALEALSAENERLREALEYYGEQAGAIFSDEEEVNN